MFELDFQVIMCSITNISINNSVKHSSWPRHTPTWRRWMLARTAYLLPAEAMILCRQFCFRTAAGGCEEAQHSGIIRVEGRGVGQ